MTVAMYEGTQIERRRCSRPGCNDVIKDLKRLWVNVRGEYVYCWSCREDASDDFESDEAWKAAFRRGTKFVNTPHVINDMEE